MNILFRSGFLAMAIVMSHTAIAAKMVDPVVLAVDAGMSKDQVHKAIKLALAQRDWRLESDKGGLVKASLNVRNRHFVTVQIRYTPKDVEISYVSSEGMDYSQESDGSKEIHRNYNNWTNNLIKSIRVNLLQG